ncbi:MAG: hypothetical protein ACOH2M_20820, partial [Cypionkella sp.]
AETGPATPRIEHLTERLAWMRGRLGELEEIGRQLQAAPDEQISLTDPDARAMATGRLENCIGPLVLKLEKPELRVVGERCCSVSADFSTLSAPY